MVLLHSPDIMLQFWLRVGTGDISDDWTTGIDVETSASMEDEKIFLVDSGMLSRLIEEIEKIMSVACKLEQFRDLDEIFTKRTTYIDNMQWEFLRDVKKLEQKINSFTCSRDVVMKRVGSQHHFLYVGLAVKELDYPIDLQRGGTTPATLIGGRRV
ncbi:unnamed protein product [Brugia pahangi]|uniref:Rx_N domain-containing protein n=1 Tax=Brugia pahangi TaxID=6280 RepID=A0A0N4TIR3_BRUPA|nr:unnamed protein product [Brugia pahangi]